MTDERFWLLASLKLSGEAAPAELAELDAYLVDNPAMQLRLSHFEAAWHRDDTSTDRVEKAFSKHLQRLSNHFSEAGLQYEGVSEPVEVPVVAIRKRRAWKTVAWVSGIAASLVLGWFVLDNSLTQSITAAQPQNTVSTKRGSKSTVRLPDGTQVWLNADSKITYNENFQGKLREVTLSGEAFFDVVRDEDRPFVIHTNYLDVKVLGTAFNVRSYADEKNTETSLIRGSVEITLRNHPEKKFTLKPNDKLIINNDEAAPAPTQASEKPSSKEIVLTWKKVNYREKTDTVATEVLWTKNKLAFDKESFERIALTIERWYDVKVLVTDEKIRKTEFSLTIDDENLQQVMEALREAGGKFKYSINKKEVVVRPL